MNLKKRLPLIVSIVAVLSLIIALVIFIFAVPNADAAYKSVLNVILASLLLLLACCAGYYLFVTRDVDPNFFLFDRAKKRNIPVENLTFTIVNERMTFFLTMVCESVEQLWQENVLESERKLGYRRVYRPLLAYKMLYDLADKNLETYWNAMLDAKPEIIDSLCAALKQGGEQEMVRALRFILDNHRGNPERIKDFVMGNQKYIRGRMLSYIKRNIELFY